MQVQKEGPRGKKFERGPFNSSDEHKKLAVNLVIALARALALRLRHAESELILLREY